MIRIIPDLIDADGVKALRTILDRADWIDGNETSGPQAALAKRNQQLPEFGDAAVEAGRMVIDALGRSPLFMAAALPLKIYPPFFNRYSGGEAFGDHIDNAVRMRRGTDFRIRSDLSATLFLTEPDEYEGGELRIEGNSGTTSYKLPAGSMLLYPSTTLHKVEEVKSGERVSCFMWMQSLVADHAEREMLYDLDRTTQALSAERGKSDREVLVLTQLYHNLVRRWAEA